jgi:hypothetical protein
MGSQQPFGASCRTGLLVLLLSSVPALPQSGICVLTQDKRNPNEKILRCGQELTITPAPGTVYRPAPVGNGALPTSVQLDSGALLIEFKPQKRREFQILTPEVIASIRGTRWAMEVKPGLTSTLVLRGTVVVARKDGTGQVAVGPGQGVDVSTAGQLQPITVKAWAPPRVKELLDRFR